MVADNGDIYEVNVGLNDDILNSHKKKSVSRKKSMNEALDLLKKLREKADYNQPRFYIGKQLFDELDCFLAKFDAEA